MIIAIPVDYKSLESTICMSFGRTPYFLIFDTETKEEKFIDNSAAANASGAGIKAAQALIDAKVEAILTPRCGENAIAVLNPAGIKVYKTTSYNLKENMEAFYKGELNILDTFNKGLHHHGGNA